MAHAPRLLATLPLLSLLAPALAAQGLPPGFQESVVWSGIAGPTAVRFAPDGHVFVAQKSGLLLVYDSPSDTSATVFADLRTQVYDVWDRGLLGLAIDPGYPANPYVYVLYTYDYLGIESSCTDLTGSGCMARGRVARLQADVSAGPVMVGAPQILIEDWCQQFPSHSVGDLHFGLDGALYVSGGDGASFNYVDQGQTGNPCGDPAGEGGALRSQDQRTSADPQTMDGTLLRVDPATGNALPDNPLYGGSVPGDDRIVAHGLRNPFRFNVRPGLNEVWIGDVGWGLWEEIDVVRDPVDALVENFGWPCYEGVPRQSGYDGANSNLCETLYTAGSGAVVNPFYAYVHTGGASITGIAFYQGTNFPQPYRDALFFADYSERWIKVMHLDAGGEPDPTQIETFRSNVGPVDLQIGPDDYLYYCDLGSGQVRRIEYFLGNQPPVAVAQADRTSGSAPLLVQLDGSLSWDPDAGDSLGFAWDLDGDGAFDDSTLVSPQHTFTGGGSHLVRLRVTDGSGASDIDALTISVDNTPPVVSIQSPAAGVRWRVGDALVYQGNGVDAEDGLLPPASLDWKISMFHCDEDHPDDCHEHLIEEIEGDDQGVFTAVDHEYPCYLRFELSGEDAGAADWWSPAWGLRQKLVLDNSASSSALADFPLLVRLDPSRIDYASLRPDGADLRFVSANGSTQLAHQVESWVPGGDSIVWVRVPLLPAGSSTSSIWMYYGNPSASSGQNAAAVWSNAYAAVWHLDPSLADSTANANQAVNAGSSASAGWLGGARSFDGIDDYVDCGSGASLALTGSLTIEAWVRVGDTSLNAAMRVLSKKSLWNSAHGYNLEHHPFENTVTTVGSGSDYGRANAIDLDTASWHYLAATIQGSSARVYVDGVDRTTDSSVTPLIASSQPLHIGRRSGGGDHFLGSIDEVRIASVARSADWLRAQHLSMSDAMVRYEPPQGRGQLSASTTLDLFPETGLLELRSRPSGLELVTSGESRATPYQKEAVLLGSLSVSAPSPQLYQGRLYWFHGWSDGGAATHQVTVVEGMPPLTATYLPVRPRTPQ